MRAFTCSACHQLVFFENSACLRCGAELGFDPVTREVLTFPDGLASDPDRHPCADAGLAACTWLVREPGVRCASCALTRARPGDGHPEDREHLRIAEAAKRRLLYELGEHGLATRDGGPVFDLRSSRDGPVTTGHADGVITLDLAEAADSDRAARREELGEPYRTVLGHFRHESGHYFWPDLVAAQEALLHEFRGIFGDERRDYQKALERHYRDGAPPGWEQAHVSAYATMHPWEDWAETWAHHLHITDAIQTAGAYGLRTPLAEPEEAAAWGFRAIVDAWIPLTIALNQLNRSMGRRDLYPFVLTAEVVEKLAFVDRVVRRHRMPTGATS